MGTSSILAAALIACVGRACGYAYDANTLIHAVLQVRLFLYSGGRIYIPAHGFLSCRLAFTRIHAVLRVRGRYFFENHNLINR
jgi:hypothetical protein